MLELIGITLVGLGAMPILKVEVVPGAPPERPVVLRQWIENPTDKMVELPSSFAIAAESNDFLHLASGENFSWGGGRWPNQMGSVPHTQQAAPAQDESPEREFLPPGKTSPVRESNLQRAAPHGCPSGLAFLPPGNYSMTVPTLVVVEGEAVVLRARASFVIPERADVRFGSYVAWRNLVTQTRDDDFQAAARFRVAHPKGLFAVCASALELVRQARSNPAAARRRMEELAPREKRYEAAWRDHVANRIEDFERYAGKRR